MFERFSWFYQGSFTKIKETSHQPAFKIFILENQKLFIEALFTLMLIFFNLKPTRLFCQQTNQNLFFFCLCFYFLCCLEKWTTFTKPEGRHLSFFSRQLILIIRNNLKKVFLIFSSNFFWTCCECSWNAVLLFKKWRGRMEDPSEIYFFNSFLWHLSQEFTSCKQLWALTMGLRQKGPPP